MNSVDWLGIFVVCAFVAVIGYGVGYEMGFVEGQLKELREVQRQTGGGGK